MNRIEILSVLIGKAETISGGLSAAMHKQRMDQRIWLWPQGLGQDSLGDERFHGGPERALHHYPAEHYVHWRQSYPQTQWVLPGFGENLSTIGVREEQVCIGDIFRWGDTVLQISQPRSACYRLNLDGQFPELAQQVQDNGRCGWFYRVLKPGYVSPRERLELVQRPFPALTVARAHMLFYHRPLDRSGLVQLQRCEGLSMQWREIAARRLLTGEVEDWNARLQGLPLEGVIDAEVRRYA